MFTGREHSMYRRLDLELEKPSEKRTVPFFCSEKLVILHASFGRLILRKY